MNVEQLNVIKERAVKASEGPWYNASNFGCIVTFDEDMICGEVERDSDAEFIAHARQDIPQLVKEVERLQSELVSAIEHADYRIKYSGQLSTELAIAYDEIDRLKSAITYACEMISIGESRKANDKLTEALGVPYDHFEEESE